ncbi:divalent metal cation transporter [Roseateles aquatilis]|uniref:Divalent metal cation transporter MntH n=1 Tax=Roseateles aquatilis TaxID=431061 RepID=A0A246JCH0_9BURK|nr:Nramp family divalent metal transporter [Roseateles aquatilis]OWQ90362.1 divalent metal cation transporter [Roseateles aquatilis]
MTPPPAIAIEPDIGLPVNGPSLGAAHRSVPVAQGGAFLRRLRGFLGPGYLVAVGYMDPGNWATDIAGGSRYGYALLWVVAMSSLMAMILQVMAARLGIASGLDLAQACRAHSPRRTVVWQWLLCEIAICACDLAEVIGTAIALKLLFDLPLAWGVSLTVLDAVLILWLQQRGFRQLEAVILALLTVVFVCFGINLALADPQWGAVMRGFMPVRETITDPGMLYIAIGIVGATVMPHNLYLHSSVVQTRRFETSTEGKRDALRFARIDIVMALSVAFLINAAILITAGAVFHANGHRGVEDLQDAYRLLDPLTGAGIASVVFGVALLASGLSSTVTATLAGQIVMEGFVNLRMPAWARRLTTRAVAVVPALVVCLVYGDEGIGRLLLFSQVVLSLQLPFAIVPLIRFTASRRVMGELASSRWTTAVASVIVAVIMALNAVLVVGVIVG